MKRIYVILLLIAVVGVDFFFPKRAGGSLCGPVCPPNGLHYYEQQCLGIKSTETVVDAYLDVCYGLPMGEKKCYGIPFIEGSRERIELDCDYPCNDRNLKDMCNSADEITLNGATYGCGQWESKCIW